MLRISSCPAFNRPGSSRRGAAHGRRAPGSGSGPHEEDLPALKSAATALLSEAGASPSSCAVNDDLAGAGLLPS